MKPKKRAKNKNLREAIERTRKVPLSTPKKQPTAKAPSNLEATDEAPNDEKPRTNKKKVKKRGLLLQMRDRGWDVTIVGGLIIAAIVGVVTFVFLTNKELGNHDIKLDGLRKDVDENKDDTKQNRESFIKLESDFDNFKDSEEKNNEDLKKDIETLQSRR